MRGACWGCLLAFAAGYVEVVCATISDKIYKQEESDTSKDTPPTRLDWQKMFVKGTLAELREDILEFSEKDDRRDIQNIIVTTTTRETAVTVTYPKITEGPSLLKRKLGSNRWDLIHEGIQGQKRDASSCPADYQLCPKSMNGGCCPNDRACGTSSCLPTTAGPTSACGKLGYVACGIDDGGGCCPGGYVCGQAGCSPSAGVSDTQTCGPSQYLCPASVNGGCCPSGMGCAIGGCYTTSISTFTWTQTITTTDARSNTVTITTAALTALTPSAPTDTVAVASNLIPKVTSAPTAIAKTAATGSSSSKNGLSGAEIGGIIGGAVAFLVIILVVAYFIIRRLNTAIKAASDGHSRTHTSSSGPNSGRSRPRVPRRSETLDVDAMSVDPLMMAGTDTPNSTHLHKSYQSSSTTPTIYEVDASPPTFMSPFSPRSPPHTHYPRGYNAVAPSDSASNPSAHRNPSLESTPPMSQTNKGYFDVPLRSDRSSQSSIPRRPSAHGRNWSNASEESEVSAASSGPIELDANAEPVIRKHSLLQRFGMGKLSLSRKRSDPQKQVPVLTGGPTSGRPEWASPGLGHIPEAGESRQQVDVIGPVGLPGTRLREAGLSNSQLREMTMTEQNLYVEEKI